MLGRLPRAPRGCRRRRWCLEVGAHAQNNGTQRSGYDSCGPAHAAPEGLRAPTADSSATETHRALHRHRSPRRFLGCDLSVCVSCSGFSHRAALRRAACLSKQEHAFVHPRGWKNRLSCESRVEEHTIETDPIKYDLEEAHSRGAKWLCSRRPDSKAAAGGARSIAT